MKKSNKDKFVEKSNLKHDYKYDYSLVEYVDSQTKVKIICPEHGEFEQVPANHSNRYGCPSCGGTKKINTKIFIEKANLKHNNKYDYSLVKYVNNKLKVKIICPEHGEFEQRPDNHLNGQRCPICHGTHLKAQEDFIEECNLKHNNKFDYSLVKYENAHSTIEIICPKHGIFEQKANSHLNGCSCSKCSFENIGKNQTKTLDNFIKECSLKHNNKYGYSNVEYIRSSDKVDIICPKHGEFKQIANNHSMGQGCPSCKSSKGEEMILDYLCKNNIKHIQQHKFSGCINKRELPFDFYLPEHNLCIEYDGIQHYESIEYFGGEVVFNETKKRDGIKSEFCLDNKISLLRIPYYDYDKIENILDSILQ